MSPEGEVTMLSSGGLAAIGLLSMFMPLCGIIDNAQSVKSPKEVPELIRSIARQYNWIVVGPPLDLIVALRQRKHGAEARRISAQS